MARDRWATFDCYGTLIDWNGGLRAALGSDELLARYHELEPEVEREDPSRSYREVLTEVARRIGAEDPDSPARSLPSWEPFPEVRSALTQARDRGWRFAILSNTDRDFIEASIERIGVPFELAIDVHVAASLFHDIAPANGLGLTTVWVNRLGERPGPEPTHEIADLNPLPDVLERL